MNTPGLQSRIAPILISVSLVVACVFGMVEARGMAVSVRAAKVTKAQTPLEYLPSARASRLLALGHDQALADLFWIRGVLYFANEVRQRRSFEWLAQYIEVIISLDADFIDVYEWGGAVMILSQRKIEYKHVEMANTILERGVHQFKDNWRLPESAAANCAFYVKDPSPEEKTKLKACREKFIQLAASRPDAPYTLTLMAATLMEGDEKKMCQLLIDAYLSRPQDIDLRQQVINRMRGGQCSGLSSEEQLKEYDETFNAEHNKHYSYAPPDLMVHLHDMGAEY